VISHLALGTAFIEAVYHVLSSHLPGHSSIPKSAVLFFSLKKMLGFGPLLTDVCSCGSASVVAAASVPVAVTVSLLANGEFPVRLSELKEPRFTLHYELDGGIQVVVSFLDRDVRGAIVLAAADFRAALNGSHSCSAC
jgi:hypothetical protein